VHLVGFIVRIYHDARSPERQIKINECCQLSANLYNIYHCCVYSEDIPDDGQRNCPKQIEFYSKNKFEKLVHLVRFIIRIYHDARSPERQNSSCR